jgi:hypothetical protein
LFVQVGHEPSPLPRACHSAARRRVVDAAGDGAEAAAKWIPGADHGKAETDKERQLGNLRIWRYFVTINICCESNYA